MCKHRIKKNKRVGTVGVQGVSSQRRMLDFGRVFVTLALILAMLLSPVVNTLTHGPAAHAAAEAGADHAHGHSHEQGGIDDGGLNASNGLPAALHDVTDHDHPTLALIPLPPASVIQRQPDTPRPAPHLSDGRERAGLLRPPRATA